jgi:hypothetical protein
MKTQSKSDQLCIKCYKRPIHNKKRKLCKSCYSALQSSMRRKGESLLDKNNLCSATIQKHENRGELEFVRNFFNHKNWLHEPARFVLNGTTYTPDFYDQERNTWIEVSATKQAYFGNKRKYDLFREIFPELNFEIRRPDGEILDETSSINGQL